jgi:hypothetical protein
MIARMMVALAIALVSCRGCDVIEEGSSLPDDPPEADSAEETELDEEVDTGASSGVGVEPELESDPEPELDTGLEEAVGPDLWHLPMTGTLSIYSEGRWADEAERSVFCDSVYTFTGHAYVGDCEGCNFEWAIDTVEHSVVGPECSSADYVSLRTTVMGGRTLVQSDVLHNFSEEAGYAYPYHDAVAMRSGHESYRMFISEPYIMTGVSRGDGEINWSRTSWYWDHHAGESSVCVGAHHYTEPHEWPAEFYRTFEFSVNYAVDTASP